MSSLNFSWTGGMVYGRTSKGCSSVVMLGTAANITYRVAKGGGSKGRGFPNLP